MALPYTDTIVAPITGLQPAAVAWIRLSGPESWSISARVFRNWPEEPMSHKAVYGSYVHGDSGLALPFQQDHSYTGEEAVELSVHGSTVSVRNLVEACRAEGARMAEPGEFTLRAFLNGRIDLTQAEAVRDTVEAQTDAQLRLANLNRKGLLRREIQSIRQSVLSLLASVEAAVDFSEEIGDLDRSSVAAATQRLIDDLDTLIATSHSGKLIRQGFRVAIVGPPNAGKSSLLNAFLGEERAIVTPIPGTTRDYVEEIIEVGGLPVVLIDTAGLRSTDEPVESIGIERTHAIAEDADAIWYVFDAAVGWSGEDQARVDGFERPVTIVANKSDLATPSVGVPISALKSEGLSALMESVVEGIESSPTGPQINLRHQPLLSGAKACLEESLCVLHHAPDDLLSVLFADAASQLGQITGETAMPDMIERIFHDFCIGK